MVGGPISGNIITVTDSSMSVINYESLETGICYSYQLTKYILNNQEFDIATFDADKSMIESEINNNFFPQKSKAPRLY